MSLSPVHGLGSLFVLRKSTLLSCSALTGGVVTALLVLSPVEAADTLNVTFSGTITGASTFNRPAANATSAPNSLSAFATAVG